MDERDELDCPTKLKSGEKCGGQLVATNVTEYGLHLRCSKCTYETYASWTYQDYRELRTKKDNANRPFNRRKR